MGFAFWFIHISKTSHPGMVMMAIIARDKLCIFILKSEQIFPKCFLSKFLHTPLARINYHD